MRHHTKDKGDLALFKAQSDLCEKGYIICLPITEHAPFDLIIYKDYQIKTVQVKYRKMKNGAFSVKFINSWADKHGTHEKEWDKKSVDLVCVFCPDTNLCYYFNPSDFDNSHQVNFRIEEPKRKQPNQYGYRYAKDYLIIED